MIKLTVSLLEDKVDGPAYVTTEDGKLGVAGYNLKDAVEMVIKLDKLRAQGSFRADLH